MLDPNPFRQICRIRIRKISLLGTRLIFHRVVGNETIAVGIKFA